MRLFVTPWTVAHQAPLPMGFPRQEYWSWLPFPVPGDLPDPGMEPTSPALQADSLPSHWGSPSLDIRAATASRTVTTPAPPPWCDCTLPEAGSKVTCSTSQDWNLERWKIADCLSGSSGTCSIFVQNQNYKRKEGWVGWKASYEVVKNKTESTGCLSRSSERWGQRPQS